jgi:hypothetical protein
MEKTKQKAFLAVLAFLWVLPALGTEGFDVGPQAELIPVRGTAIADCTLAGHVETSKLFSCQGYVFRPEELSYFVGTPMDADTIRLTVTHESGSTATKKQEFDSAKGRSKKPFALWGGSLLNRAIMKPGRNAVRFEYLKQGQVVRDGSFE